MLFKLAMRNMQRSMRDYAVYFVTLLIAVTIFYAFNSIGDQQVMHDIEASNKTNVIELTGYLISLLSIVIAFVLGFLVIYSNQLLVNRRKREFGIYLTLGMKAGQVSRILLYETVLVGLLSLVGGIALGVLVSQLLSFATAALFGVAIPNYQFDFSMRAFAMTLACFAAIYIVVAIFNVIAIRRRRLIDLINAEGKSQRAIIRNPWVCLALFIVSIGILAYAYQQLMVNGMTLIADEEFNRATIGMLVGTLLLFFSLSGFIIAILTRAKGVYYRKLRPFTTRQVASKINSSFASIWIVCVLLFFAITTFATGMALVDAFMKDVEEANPYDASVISYQAVADTPTGQDGPNERHFDVTQTQAFLQENLEGWDDLVADSAALTVYGLPGVTYGDAMAATGASVPSSNGYIDKQLIDVVGLSQFNDVMQLQGKPAVALGEGEYLVTNNMAASQDLAAAMAASSFELQTPAGALMPQEKVLEVQLSDYSMLSNGATVVIPDAVFASIEPDQHEISAYLNIMFTPESGAADVFFERVIDTHLAGVTSLLTHDEMVAQSLGMRTMITYLALYIGLVLLVSVAAVLAIQLLSLTIDSLGRYRTLNRLGCDIAMLGRSLFAQVVFYFLVPLAVALCHTAWTIHIMTGTLFDALGLDLLPTIMLSAAFVLVIYGGYMIVTYLASRSAIKQELAS